MSGIIAVEFKQVAEPNAFCHIPNWDRYRGNNHHRIRTGERWGGAVSFKRHLGKPLSPELWKDLVGRLGITGLRIYGPSDEQWTDCPVGAVIHLDGDGNVDDIRYIP